MTAKVRRRLVRDKIIGTASIQMQQGIASDRGMQTVPLVDAQGNTVGQVLAPLMHCACMYTPGQCGC